MEVAMTEADKDKSFGGIGMTIGFVFILFAILLPVQIMRHKGVLSSPIALTIMLVISGGAVWGYSYFFFYVFLGRRTKDLLKNGELAVARVLEKSDTGWTINNAPQVELLLTIHTEGRFRDGLPPYEAKVKALIPRLQPDLYDVDTFLELRVDPKNLKRIAIVGIMEDPSYLETLRSAAKKE